MVEVALTGQEPCPSPFGYHCLNGGGMWVSRGRHVASGAYFSPARQTRQFFQIVMKTYFEAPDSPASPPQRAIPVETVTLRITEHELYWAVRTRINRPILLALQNSTGTLWRLDDDGFAAEIMPPYRACILPQEAMAEVDRADMGQDLLDSSWVVPLFPYKNSLTDSRQNEPGSAATTEKAGPDV